MRNVDPGPPVRQTPLTTIDSLLTQLHTTLTFELRLRRNLERKVSDLQTALTRARAELAGTQAGERRARHRAMHDDLTSLPNRGYFRERLDHAITEVKAARSSLGVLLLDLDGFKRINDAHGHHAGDALLRIVATRLARAVRGEDMMSRLGGDEFACLPGNFHNQEQLSHLACKLFAVVSAPLKIGKLNLTVRPSIGIAIFPADGATAETLLRSADAAMYEAKRHATGYAFANRPSDPQPGRLRVANWAAATSVQPMLQFNRHRLTRNASD